MNKPAFQQPSEEEIAAEAKAREENHENAEKTPLGRKPNPDRQRTKQLGLKITAAKMDQLNRLARLARLSQTDVIEDALDHFEEAFRHGRVR